MAVGRQASGRAGGQVAGYVDERVSEWVGGRASGRAGKWVGGATGLANRQASVRVGMKWASG